MAPSRSKTTTKTKTKKKATQHYSQDARDYTREAKKQKPYETPRPAPLPKNRTRLAISATREPTNKREAHLQDWFLLCGGEAAVLDLDIAQPGTSWHIPLTGERITTSEFNDADGFDVTIMTGDIHTDFFHVMVDWCSHTGITLDTAGKGLDGVADYLAEIRAEAMRTAH